MYAIIDCDNCYVSCERVFRPDLRNKPVVVLSNNDGCVVARSNEAKKMGIKAGMPYYQLEQLFPDNKIAVFSSNYELYGELTARVVEIVRNEAPAYFRYSIDECFAFLHGMDNVNLKEWGEKLHDKIKQFVGIPVSIGIAPNKTLAKVAVYFAKRFKGYKHCAIIKTNLQRRKALELFPIAEVWGIGRRYASRMESMGILTALNFADKSDGWVRVTFKNIVVMRTWKELNGDDCIPDEQIAKKQSICTSRSFKGMIPDMENIKIHVANYAARCAEKLRRQHSVASVVAVFLNTNFFREDLPQYSNFTDMRLITPSSSTETIVKYALDCVEKIFRVGFHYKKAGVIVMGISSEDCIQQDLFDIDAERFQNMKRLNDIVDRINRVNGEETIVLAAQQYPDKDENGKAEVFANAIKHDFRSKSPTTRWSDIIRLK